MRHSRRLLLGFAFVLASCETPHALVDVGAAPRTRALALTLSGARVDVDHGGRYDRVCQNKHPTSKGGSACVDQHFYVFPVVPASAAAAPTTVPAWVTCMRRETSFDECLTYVKAYSGALGGRVVTRVDGKDLERSGWHRAVADVAETHSLATAVDAPVLELGKPETP